MLLRGDLTFMMKDDSFKDDLRPQLFGNKRFKGAYFRGVKYAGQLIAPFDTSEQQAEINHLLVKTYQDQFDSQIDQIAPIKLSWGIDAFALTILYHKEIRNRIFLFPIETVAPTLDDLISWNAKAQQIYEEDGVYGQYGIKDRGHLDYVAYTLANPYLYGVNTHPSVIDKAAYLWSNVAELQAFSNGNKRTAMIAMLVFLHSNGYDFVFHEGLKQELIDFSIKIAVKSVDFQEISSYIFNNVRLNLFNEEWHTIEQLRDDKSQE